MLQRNIKYSAFQVLHETDTGRKKHEEQKTCNDKELSDLTK